MANPGTTDPSPAFHRALEIGLLLETKRIMKNCTKNIAFDYTDEKKYLDEMVEKLEALEPFTTAISDEVRSRIIKTYTHLEDIVVASSNIGAQSRALTTFLNNHDYLTRYTEVNQQAEAAEATSQARRTGVGAASDDSENNQDDDSSSLNETLV